MSKTRLQPIPRIPTPEKDLRILFLLSRLFKDETISLTQQIDQFMSEYKQFSLSPLNSWSFENLTRARHFAEEIISLYVSLFYDVSQIPVTYYKREKWIRRHLDGQFSSLFKEIARRSQVTSEVELILEEPIYYLLQKAREKSFPKAPKSKNKRPHLAVLKMRFHVDLARRLDPEASSDTERRVLLPFEL
jgi:hypothetical protein